MLKTLQGLKWQLAAGGLLLAGLFMSRGGLGSLMPLVRVLIPVIVGIAVFRVLKKRLMASAGDLIRQRMEQMSGMNTQQAAGHQRGARGNVLDMCPKCGGVLAPGHRCK